MFSASDLFVKMIYPCVFAQANLWWSSYVLYGPTRSTNVTNKWTTGYP